MLKRSTVSLVYVQSSKKMPETGRRKERERENGKKGRHIEY
jgi:hypothetical protein